MFKRKEWMKEKCENGIQFPTKIKITVKIEHLVFPEKSEISWSREDFENKTYSRSTVAVTTQIMYDTLFTNSKGIF